MKYTIQPFGEHSLLITLPREIRPSTAGRILVAKLGVAARLGLDTVLITGRPLPTHDEITAALDCIQETGEEHTSRTITISVDYNGEDLTAVAGALGLSVEEVVTAHQKTEWRVALVGFAPGFPYLKPLDEHSVFVKVPRLATPRSQVPAGSVAVAAGMSAVYPSAMPGGWMLLGQTDAVLFDPTSQTPSLLSAGDIVKFEARA